MGVVGGEGRFRRAALSAIMQVFSVNHQSGPDRPPADPSATARGLA